MIVYVIKSAGCLALLLFFYHFVLEKEKMHRFNRYYLLGSLLFSFWAPYAKFTTYIYEQIAITDISIAPKHINNSVLIVQENNFNYHQILIGFYCLICTLLLIRFSFNLFKILQKIAVHKKIKKDNATLVLVGDKILPHTFLNYIFINKIAYENAEIEEELFTHELTHVTQKHTFDVLLIEVLQVVFWINPLFIFLKKAVQLNHEFLADDSVINKHQNTYQYQHLLLNKATRNNTYYLASNLNYSLTKKRLQMMTAKSSPNSVLLKKFAVLPLLTGFLFLFAERIEAQIEVEEIQTRGSSYQTPSGKNVTTGFKKINNVMHYFVTIDTKTKYYNKNGEETANNGISKNNKKANASEIIPGNYISKVYSNGIIFCEFFVAEQNTFFNKEYIDAPVQGDKILKQHIPFLLPAYKFSKQSTSKKPPLLNTSIKLDKEDNIYNVIDIRHKLKDKNGFKITYSKTDSISSDIKKTTDSKIDKN